MRNFQIDEFDSPDVPGSGKYMRKKFLDKLDNARDVARIPFIVNSGYRTKQHNEEVGGVSNSSHLKGYAADISCNSSIDRYKMIRAFIFVGFNRIGIGKNFIHVDCDPKKPKNVIWYYD